MPALASSHRRTERTPPSPPFFFVRKKRTLCHDTLRPTHAPYATSSFILSLTHPSSPFIHCFLSLFFISISYFFFFFADHPLAYDSRLSKPFETPCAIYSRRQERETNRHRRYSRIADVTPAAPALLFLFAAAPLSTHKPLAPVAFCFPPIIHPMNQRTNNHSGH